MRAEARNREENHTDKIVVLFLLMTEFLIVGFLELLSKFYLSTAALVGAGSGSVQAAGSGAGRWVTCRKPCASHACCAWGRGGDRSVLASRAE